MKTIIAGGRDIEDYNEVLEAINSIDWVITEVVSGQAPGVDRLGERWANANNINIEPFPADWINLDLAAGGIRNEKMAVYSEALVAIWDGVSTGTGDMIRRARSHKLIIHIHYVGARKLQQELF